MRDIQDLTLQRDRGFTAIEKKFDERSDALSHRLEKMTANPSNRHLLVVRATLLPLSTDLWVDKLFQNHAVAPLYENFYLSVRQNPERIYMPHRGSSNSRPVLGGVRYTNRISASRWIMRELMRNGLVEFLDVINTKESRHSDLSPSQFLALVMNAVLTAHKVRRYAGVPEAEYGLEVEIVRTGGDIQISEFPSPYGSSQSFDVEYNPLRLQRLSVSPPEEFNHIMKILLRDILNAAGLEAPDDVEIIIPPNLLTV